MARKIVVLLVSFVCICGCATAPEKGPRFAGFAQSKAGYSLLYIYRPYEYVGRWVWPEVFLGETRVVGLLDQSYTFVYVKPANYQIRTEKSHLVSGMSNITGSLTIEPDTTYFLLFDRKFERYGGISPSYKALYERWTLTEENEAASELRRLRYIKAYVELVER